MVPVVYDEFQFDDGRIATFVDLTEDDLPQLMSVYGDVVAEGRYFIHNVGPSDIEELTQWFHEHQKAGLMYVVAKIDSRLVGGATIEPREGKASHVAYFGVFLKRDFRGLGIGTRLTKRMLNMAQERKFKMVQLYVFASNAPAIHIYNKLGFKEAGRIKNGIRFQDGSYSDEITMTIDLK
jgi:L-amino acid N-acyltransferase YncA